MLSAESKTVSMLEKAYLIRNRGETYIACESIDFSWTRQEVNKFVRLWQDGASLQTLCETFIRPENDVGALILDQRIKGNIKPRKGGLWG